MKSYGITLELKMLWRKKEKRFAAFKVGTSGFKIVVNFVIKRSKKSISTLANSFEEDMD